MNKKHFFLLAAFLVVAVKAFSTHLTTLPTNSLNCTATIDAGEDQIVCSPGTAADLAVTVNGQVRSIDWSPANLLSDPTAMNPTATISATTTFGVTVSALSDVNLIQNGDFEQGDVGFTSAYIQGTGGNNGLLTMEGQYAIDDNSMDTHRRFAACRDNSGTGNMMVINASGNPDNIWCQSVTVSTNTDYDFSAWVSTVEQQNPARLQFSINGDLLGDVFNASTSTCLWEEFFAPWNSGNNISANICIVNVNLLVAGNDFALDDISFREICVLTDEVNVELANISADWTSPGTLCQNEPTFVLDELLDATATPGGEWFIDGQAAMTINPLQLTVGVHQLNYRATLGNCTVEVPQDIMIIGSPVAGLPAPPDRYCSSFDNPVDLGALLTGADPGGNWTETSINPSSNNAFNDQAGIFNTSGQDAGNFVFTYSVNGPAGCPPSTAEVTVIIEETPVADAGQEFVLDCVVDVITLGGSEMSVDAGLGYQWTAANGSAIPMGNTPFPDITAAGTYSVVVTNLNNGCTSSDDVEVIERVTMISASASVSPITCNSNNDGGILVDQVSGGDGPYLYAFEDGVFTAQAQFNNLSAGTYEVRVMDTNGCEEFLSVELVAPEPLTAVIVANNLDAVDPVISLGDSVLLQVLLSKDQGIESLTWQPTQENCPDCFSIWVSPTETTIYSIQVADNADCDATATISIRVDRKPRIFVPNAFSPNNDGINDFFFINAAGNQVSQVNSFQVLDRWGNLLFQREDFMPNDEHFAWDGLFNGQKVNSGVYVYFAELTLQDGSVVQAQGEVNVIY